MKNKIIFLDMDGTILNEDNRVTEHTSDVIKEVRKKGIKVFIATGRAQGDIFNLVPENFEVDGIISSNGAVGYIGEQEIFKHKLSMQAVYKLIELAEKNHIYYELFPYYKERIALEKDKEILLSELNHTSQADVEENEWKSRQNALSSKINWVHEIPEDEYSKFYFFKRNIAEIKKWREKIAPLEAELDFSTSSSTPCNLEAMPSGINKATGIQAIISALNLKETAEIYAIGDSDNDIQMLGYVDVPVVMKNAPNHIKELGKIVTEFTNEEDGVAAFLKSEFL